MKRICEDSFNIEDSNTQSETVELTDSDTSIKEENISNISSEEDEEVEIPSKRVRYNPANILAKRMAEHLEQMDPDQSLIAEKIISDICVYGRLNQLSMESTLVLQKP